MRICKYAGMIITLCNQKGGAGKTTLTLLLALALEEAGRKVAIVDKDPQQTSTRALSHLSQNNLSKITLASKPGDFDVVFIDTAPRLDKPLSDALNVSDRVILVSSPSPADLWSTQQTREFVLTHRKGNAPAAVLFNSVVAGSSIARDLDALASLIGLPALTNFIARRQAYQYAVLQGWDALRPAQRDEIKNVALEIATLSKA